METPKEKVKRLSAEWKQLIYYSRLGHRGDRHHFEDSLVDILAAYEELLSVAKEFTEENEMLKAQYPTLGLSIARGHRLS